MKIRSIGTFLAASGALLLLYVGLHAQQTAAPGGLRVLGSNGIREVVEAVKPQAEHAAGKPLAIDYNSSSATVDRIEKGENFDVAILTSDTIDDLINKGRIVSGSRAKLARAGIGVGIRKGAPKPDISSADAIKKSLLQAKAITYAQDGASRVHVEQMFGRLGIMQEMTSKIRLEQGSTKSAARVAQGGADMIITLISEIMPAEGVALVGPLPAEFQYYVDFAAGISAKSKNQDAAKALIKFLSTPASLPLAAKGMEPPAKPIPQ
jgi:molybdate transport system substrate-binding protein